jgi:hypothetical protein
MTGTLVTSIKKASEEIRTVASLIHQLSDTYALISEADALVVLWSKIAKIFDHLADYESNHVSEINEYLTTYFKFFYKQRPALVQLFKDREAYLTPYVKAETKLQAKKEKLWNTKAYKKWGIPNLTPEIQENKELAMTQMLPKETEKVN